MPKQTREELRQERDLAYASFLQRLKDSNQLVLMKDMEKIYDLSNAIEMSDGLEIRARDERMKGAYKKVFGILEARQLKVVLLCLILGIIIGLVPYLTASAKDRPLPFDFMPNAIAEHRPIYLQMIRTPEQLENIKKTNISMSSDATMGSAVSLGAAGLGMYLKRQLDLPSLHLKEISPVKDKEVKVGNYDFIPDAILTRDNSPIQILTSIEQVRSANDWKSLTYKSYLEVGAAIECPQGIPCYVISKASMKDRIITHPLSISKPEENKADEPKKSGDDNQQQQQ